MAFNASSDNRASSKALRGNSSIVLGSVTRLLFAALLAFGLSMPILPQSALAEESVTEGVAPSEADSDNASIITVPEEGQDAIEVIDAEDASSQQEGINLIQDESISGNVDVQDDEGTFSTLSNDSSISAGATNKGSITFGTTYTASLNANSSLDDEIYYTFKVTSNGAVRLRSTGKTTNLWPYFNLATSSGKSLVKVNSDLNSMTRLSSLDKTYYLNNGTYMLGVRPWAGKGSFSFSLTYSNMNLSFQTSQGGTNTSTSTARAITLGKKYTDQFALDQNPMVGITVNPKQDFFSFNLSGSSTVRVRLNSGSSSVGVNVYNASGKSLTYKHTTADNATKRSNIVFDLDLAPGKYYLAASNYYLGDGGYGTYTFSVTTIQKMYRMYNRNSGEHFYTANAAERDHLQTVGWKYEGLGWAAPIKSNTPVYRLYSGTDHHYTNSVAERNHLMSVGWKYEGIGWYSDDGKTEPLYRQFNPNVQPRAARNNAGSHNYTTSKAENDSLVRNGWREEGIGWYGL